ncbi:MAG: hypothetical protein C0594_04985 [Marinilabiliales bacterium]|nr:MAG: hypothetical protein C0594_04985 [Marinilabiliales bacterium]
MIVHIGYQKTGTTFLQNAIFKNLEGVQYYEYGHCRKIFLPFVKSTTLEFDKKKYVSLLDQSDKALYSYEGLVGSLGVGTYNTEIAYRLKDVGFKKVMITIRRQTSMLESVYKQYIHDGGVLKPHKYFAEDSLFFKWSFLDYYSLIMHYVDLFGRKNVLINLQEDLLRNAENVITQIVEFTNAGSINESDEQSKNVSLTTASVQVMRILNHMTYNFYRPSHLITRKISSEKVRGVLEVTLDPVVRKLGSGKKRVIPKKYIDKANQLYKKNNALLDKEFELGMEAYNYY